jgi:segregation and condensation protein A
MPEEKSTQLRISLPRFDGPFDLLLSLIRRNEWSIDDLPVVEITGQFLAYIKEARDLDTELAGEFVETASWLVLLKSRSLLPIEDAEGATPREELRRAVLDHATLASTTEFLRERYEGKLYPVGAGIPRGQQNQVLPASREDDPTVHDVLEAAMRALETARAAASFRSSDADGMTVQDQLLWLAQELKPLPFQTAISTADWFALQPNAAARVALLLALLELVRKGFLLIHQTVKFAPIRVKVLRQLPENLQLDEEAYSQA